MGNIWQDMKREADADARSVEETEATIARLTRERDEARAALADTDDAVRYALRERDEARAEVERLTAVLQHLAVAAKALNMPVFARGVLNLLEGKE
jgi:nitroreductase